MKTVTIAQTMEAMNKTSWQDGCWWEHAPTIDVLMQAEKQGWLIRSSVTQIQWSEEGIVAWKKHKATKTINLKLMEKLQEAKALLLPKPTLQEANDLIDTIYMLLQDFSDDITEGVAA